MARARTIRFLGAAGTVTGSKHLVTIDEGSVLLDCGLFQGLKALRLRNWQPHPFDAARLRAVVLSHAHLDHCGALPLLVRAGFKGPIHCTPGTKDLVEVILLDAAHLQEEEAEIANRYGYSKHTPALPLYTTDDAKAALGLLQMHAYGQPFRVIDAMSAVYHRAGHILGAATVTLDLERPPRRRLVFSGDLGRWNRPIIRDPELVKDADVLLVESTYGDRVHTPDPEGALARVVREAAARGGALIIPAFAVGRTQELIWTLRRLEEAGTVPSLPVFVDSPMAINVTEIYCRHPEDHDLDMKLLADATHSPLRCREYHLVRTAEESKALNAREGPFIIISASGMATGGRVIHHLKARLPDERTTVLLPGFQAAGTRGRALHDGAREVRIHGTSVPVRATIVTLDGFSAHADRDEILRWLGGFERAPREVLVVHGEPQASDSLAALLRARLRWNARVAQDGETVTLA
ncbi:MAG TPA: MBL fold metallo-hydrolase [Candidatus Eisenbacteria bacterium]|nr:MBL fold metallo-hydrolase [Candidatus Eisenbacteria bacterium]